MEVGETDARLDLVNFDCEEIYEMRLKKHGRLEIFLGAVRKACHIIFKTLLLFSDFLVSQHLK